MEYTGKEKLLKGKTFISTRPAGRSEVLKKFFRDQGAGLMEMPMINIQKAQLSSNEKEVINRADKFNWIVFTSSNGVSHFFDHLKDTSGSYLLGENVKIAVIGKDTGSELSRFGHAAHYVSSTPTGRAFSEELRKLFRGKNQKVLLPLGNLAGKTIEKELEGISEVFRINVYNTEMPGSINYEAMKCIQDDNYEMIIFTSNSGFSNFCLIAKGKINFNSLRIACIGSTTSEAVSGSGITPLVTAKKMNSQGIAEAIMNYYK